jgi:molybdenum cofactor guanylyltransferase
MAHRFPSPDPADSDTRASRRSTLGLILAGGQGQRFGGLDKGLVSVAGRPFVEWAIAALAPQVQRVAISANRHLEAYASLGIPVIPDRMAGFLGPLAGIVSAMETIPSDWVLCLPCDAPMPPANLIDRLFAALENERAEIAAANDGHRIHPLHALIPNGLAASLRAYLDTGERSVLGWYRSHRLAIADCSDCPDAFANANTPEDAQRLAERLEAGSNPDAGRRA